MYENQTPEAIKAEMLEGISGDWDTREGSFADDMLGPMASALHKMYGALNAVKPMAWVDETSGPYLDMAAEDLGLEPRKLGTKAKAILEIQGSANHIITAGTTFLTDSNQYFYTTEDAVIPETAVVTVEAEAAEIGSGYNVESGAICNQFSNSASIIAVANPEPAQGGTNAETDKELFVRIDLARKKPRTSGNKYDYEEWATAVDGVGMAKAYPLWEGPGTVKILVAAPDGQPVEQAIIQKCTDHIERLRPVGALVTVVSSVPKEITVEMSVKAYAEVDTQAITRQFQDAVTAYLAGLSLQVGEIVNNYVGSLLVAIPGVLDYSDLRLNGESGNISLTGEESLKLGEVSLRWS
ncbi:baseplate J/gp47 family protein [Oscillospiraceae bacterium MB08-C2-2]|nr:baseplate J/gp47 family protein [Oscillospiraceae bacterium MB08-C2-2]